MYFLWRNKPRAVLGVGREWIPIADLPQRLDNVVAFSTAREARALQQGEYSRAGTSVLNRKTFQQKTKLSTLPVFKTFDSEGASPPDLGEKPMYYADYLDKLCATVAPSSNTVVFPPSNLKEIFDTPLILQIKKLLTDIQEGIVALEDEETRLRDEIRHLDLLTADRIHEVEMDVLAPEECVMFVAALHEKQIERRKRKNELATVMIAKDLLQVLDKSDFKDGLREIEKLGKQEYHCRVLTEDDPLIKRKHIKKTAG